MIRLRTASCLTLLLASTACSGLNYPGPNDPGSNDPEPTSASGAAGLETSASASATESRGAPSAPVPLSVGEDLGVQELPGLPDDGSSKEWSELTRQARIDRQRGKFEAARDGLEQAARQLSSRRAANTQRRAVLGLRARLAMDFVALKQAENADALAQHVFDEVEQDPELGGPAVVELAYLFATRRASAAEKAGVPDSQLALLRIALTASEPASASQNRLGLAFEVSEKASRAGDYALARRAIDLARLDAQIIAPSDKDQLASLEIFKTRIALAQGDLMTAEASAASANRLFAEIDAGPASLAVAEATLARVLAEKGEVERARAIATGAEARLAGDPPIPEHTARIVLAELARLERAAGDTQASRAHYAKALALPAIAFEADGILISKLKEELAALDLER